MVRWLVRQVDQHGLKETAELLEYDPANLAKVVAGKRKISRELAIGLVIKWLLMGMVRREDFFSRVIRGRSLTANCKADIVGGMSGAANARVPRKTQCCGKADVIKF